MLRKGAFREVEFSGTESAFSQPYRNFKILNQTPEIVEMVLLGGSHKTYPTLEFLKQNPNNITVNFRLNVTFGIDYQHQSLCTREIPDTLQRILREELYNEGFEKDILNLKVEFKDE